MVLYQGDVTRSKDTTTSSSYLGNDPFFTKNYNNRFTGLQ
jgi:hypothetical protein